ncbi:YigZ family protein [Methanothermococcus sp. Ax23]|uniref:YigZ family protein n=1 Tax=Methanothermococcus sp. Ax23 TaxID=3156486 RepID=UPI003BA1CB71
MSSYKTIAKVGSSKKVFKNSVFIGYASPVKNEEEAKDFINKIKNHHSDANHNVYAYIVDNHLKYDDDGEPSGSAGKPIMNILELTHLKNIVVVVSRYFGGIKLGYGGLVRAYSDTAKEAVENAKIIEVFEKECFKVELPYNLLSIVKKIVIEENGEVVKEDYADTVVFTIAVRKGTAEKVIKKLIDHTKGNIKIKNNK